MGRGARIGLRAVPLSWSTTQCCSVYESIEFLNLAQPSIVSATVAVKLSL